MEYTKTASTISARRLLAPPNAKRFATRLGIKKKIPPPLFERCMLRGALYTLALVKDAAAHFLQEVHEGVVVLLSLRVAEVHRGVGVQVGS